MRMWTNLLAVVVAFLEWNQAIGDERESGEICQRLRALMRRVHAASKVPII